MHKVLLYITLIVSFMLMGCGGGGGGGSESKANIELKIDFASSLDIKALSTPKIPAVLSDGEPVTVLTLKYGKTQNNMTSLDVLSNVQTGSPVTLEGLTLGTSYIFSIEAENSLGTVLCNGTASAVIAAETTLNLTCSLVEPDSAFKVYASSVYNFDSTVSDVLDNGKFVAAGTFDDAQYNSYASISVFSKTMKPVAARYFNDESSYSVSKLYGLTHDKDGYIYAMGFHYVSAFAGNVPVVIKMDEDLNIIWTKHLNYNFGLGEAGGSYVADGVPLKNGGVGFVLIPYAGMTFIAVSSNGDISYQSYFAEDSSSPIEFNSITMAVAPGSQNIVICASVTNTNNSLEYTTIFGIDPDNFNVLGSAYVSGESNEYIIYSGSYPGSYTNYVFYPMDMTVDSNGNIFVIANNDDELMHLLMKVPSNFQETLADKDAYATSSSFIAKAYTNSNASTGISDAHIAVNETGGAESVVVSFDELGRFYTAKLNASLAVNWVYTIYDTDNISAFNSVGVHPLADGAFANIVNIDSIDSANSRIVNSIALAKFSSEGDSGNFDSYSGYASLGTTYFVQDTSVLGIHDHGNGDMETDAATTETPSDYPWTSTGYAYFVDFLEALLNLTGGFQAIGTN